MIICTNALAATVGPCRSIPDEKSKTIPVPGGADLSLFQI
jgi:hypothetical protein